jgi:hypothetical protein
LSAVAYFCADDKSISPEKDQHEGGERASLDFWQ